MLKHIEFPYFNEPPPPKEKILDELLYFIEVLCVSEMYANELTIDKKNRYHEQEEQVNIDLSIDDWNTFNIEDVIPETTTHQQNNVYNCKNTTNSTTATTTTIPLHLPISSLWNILRLRQICVTMETMIQYLSLLDNDKYQLLNDLGTLQVKTSFKLDLTDTHSATSFSSRESW